MSQQAMYGWAIVLLWVGAIIGWWFAYIFIRMDDADSEKPLTMSRTLFLSILTPFLPIVAAFIGFTILIFEVIPAVGRWFKRNWNQ